MNAPRRRKPVVAIDGPAGAGKSTVTRKVAERLGYLIVDTGALYRVVALAAERAGVSAEDETRVAALADALAVLGERPITVGRELTKQYEEIATVACAGLPAWVNASPQRARGEFALVLHPLAVVADDEEPLRVLRLLLAELPVKTAVRLAVDITGAPRNALYQAALAAKRDGDEGA